VSSKHDDMFAARPSPRPIARVGIDSPMASLVRKLRPELWPNLSPRLRTIVGFVLGQEWTAPVLSSLAITADGQVVAGEEGYIGVVSDLDRNLNWMLAVADLTAEERALFDRLRASRIEDHRTPTIDLDLR